MATLIEKIETELVGLIGENGRQTLHSCLQRVNGLDGEMQFFNKVALVQELSKTFSMIMPEDRMVRFKLKLLSMKGDDEL